MMGLLRGMGTHCVQAKGCDRSDRALSGGAGHAEMIGTKELAAA